MKLTKRATLRLAVAGAAFPAGAAAARIHAAEEDALRALVAHPESARRIAGIVIAAGVMPADRKAALEILCSHLGNARGADSQALRRRMRDAIREDFAQGAVVTAGGWVLARSEAALCVLVACQAS